MAQKISLPKIVKLDRRFTGRDFFAYALDYRYGESKKQCFILHRIWFWETFGPSAEFLLWHNIPISPDEVLSQNWAWDTNYDQRRIYVRDSEILSLFLLRFA